MSPSKRYANKPAKARQRRRQQAQERLKRDRHQAQRAAAALHQARETLGRPDNLVAEIEGRLRSQHKRLGKSIGVMFPALFGCRTPSALCRVRGWDKNLPARLLNARPTRSWIKRLRRLGLEVLAPIWRHGQDQSPATQSRWQWTWVWDDAVLHTYGAQVRVVGRGWSGQHKRVLSGIEGLLLLVVVGDGRLGVPVAVAMRRPDPAGPGAPCRDTRTWARVMLEERLAALRRRGLEWPAPMGVADRWLGDSKRMPHGRDAHQGTLVGEGKASYCLTLADGRQVKGPTLIEGKGWHWQEHPWEAGGRSVRLRAPSPTSGQVTVIIVDEAGQDRFSLWCVETERSAPQVIRRWRRRSGIAFVLRIRKPLLATESCQGHNEDAYYGHLVLRLLGSVILFYTSRVIGNGRLTMEEMILSLKHSWRFVDVEALE